MSTNNWPAGTMPASNPVAGTTFLTGSGRISIACGFRKTIRSRSLYKPDIEKLPTAEAPNPVVGDEAATEFAEKGERAFAPRNHFRLCY